MKIQAKSGIASYAYDKVISNQEMEESLCHFQTYICLNQEEYGNAHSGQQ
jgi:hypothetical protein